MTAGQKNTPVRTRRTCALALAAAVLAGAAAVSPAAAADRAADDTVEEALRELSATGAQVTYRQCDVSDRRQVDALVAEIGE
ncbi:KR domain-containing protein, partial [Streptomyces sp. NPDC059506]|uniref:KR domain-containing protein n=1 Tax=Streptomyces sp. NPDC059506 TaxID=3347751 RepID=UPI00368F887F